MRNAFWMSLALVVLASPAARADDWTNVGGDAGMTKYSPGNIGDGLLQQVYTKRFYSKWQDWVGGDDTNYYNPNATYMTANNVVIRGGVAVVQSNDAPDNGNIWGPLYTTVFDWATGTTRWKVAMRSSGTGDPDYATNPAMWFHSGENYAEIDTNHYRFPTVFGSDNRIYMRRGGDQRAMGAMSLSSRTWAYLPADLPVPNCGWAGDAAASITLYKDRLLFHPGDTRDGWNYASQDVSAAQWSAGTPGQSAVWIPNAAPRITGNQVNDGLRAAGDIPKAAQDVAVVAGWYNTGSASTAKTYVTASNVYTGQQLWSKTFDSSTVGGTGFYAGTSDYWQFVATEDGQYAMFNRPSGQTAKVRVLDLLTGDEKWNKTLISDASPLMAYSDGYLYIVARNEQMKVNADTGAVAWRLTNSFTGDTCKNFSRDPIYRPMVLTDDTLWFVNNFATGGDHLVGMRTSDGQIIKDLNLQSLYGSSEVEIGVQDLVAADHKLGVFLDIKQVGDVNLLTADASHPNSNPSSPGQRYQDLVVFQTPEPASLAILSLGAVALLRRRK